MRELIRRGYVFAVLRMRFDRDERGASMVEYGLLVALIAVVAAVAVAGLGTNITATFTKVKNCVANTTTC
jgi:pilus assembly protein Flp/PilA